MFFGVYFQAKECRYDRSMNKQRDYEINFDSGGKMFINVNVL